MIDLLTIDGRCIGALSLNLTDGEYTLNLAMVTILATGGAGQVYARTTNPEVATGDGVAMAYRAGASIRDLEFVQFHPTGLAAAGSPTPLITEALRGEGALLRNAAGERFMTAVDPKAELAARDVVVRGMVGRDAPRRLVARLPGRDGVSTPTCCASRFPRVTALLSRARPRPEPRPHPGRSGRALLHRRRRDRRLGPHHGARPVRRAARWRAPACTAPTALPRTRCSRASSSAIAWCATSTATSAASARTCAACTSSCRRPRAAPRSTATSPPCAAR